LRALGAALWLVAAGRPVLADHDHRGGGEPGPYAIGHTSLMLVGEGSGRPVAVDVFYPADPRDIGPGSAQALYTMDPYFHQLPDTTSSDWEAQGYDRAFEAPRPSRHGPFPLVMYSSGLTFPTWANLFLGTRLASHGYVFATLQHFGEGAWPWHPWEGIANIAFNRPRDVSFALTELLKRNHRSGDLLHRLIDPRRVVAGGHSFGGYAAMALTAGDDSVCDALILTWFGEEIPPGTCAASEVDPRFAALFALEGSQHMMRFEELARVSVPSLMVGGSVERQSPVQDEWRSFIARPHAAIARRDAFRVDLQDTDHFSYSSYCDGVRMMHDRGALSDADWTGFYEPVFCAAPLPRAEGHRLVDAFVLAFLDRYVGHRSDGATRLTPGWVREHEPLAELFRREKCDAFVGDPTSRFTYRPHNDGSCEVGDKNPASWF
jgi:predicted dienelactone hydrolase